MPLGTWQDGPCSNSLVRFKEVRKPRGSPTDLAEAVRREQGPGKAAGSQLVSADLSVSSARQLGAFGGAEVPDYVTLKVPSPAEVPWSEECLSTAEDPTHAAEQVVRAREIEQHVAEEPVSAAEEPVCASEEPVSSAEELMSVAEEPMSAADEHVISAEEPVSAANEPAQLAEDSRQAAGTEKEQLHLHEGRLCQVNDPMVEADSPVIQGEEENSCAGDSAEEEDGHALNERKPWSRNNEVDVELVPRMKDYDDVSQPRLQAYAEAKLSEVHIASMNCLRQVLPVIQQHNKEGCAQLPYKRLTTS